MKAAKSHPPLSLNVNAIFDGRFVFAGTVLDQQTLATLPATFKKYIVPAESESDEAEQVVTNFQMNTPYGVDQNGRLRQRNVERQVSEQIRSAQFQEAMDGSWPMKSSILMKQPKSLWKALSPTAIKPKSVSK